MVQAQVEQLRQTVQDAQARAAAHPHVEEVQAHLEEAQDLLSAAQDHLHNLDPQNPLLAPPAPSGPPSPSSQEPASGEWTPGETLVNSRTGAEFTVNSKAPDGTFSLAGPGGAQWEGTMQDGNFFTRPAAEAATPSNPVKSEPIPVQSQPATPFVAWHDLPEEKQQELIKAVQASSDALAADPKWTVEKYRAVPETMDARIVSGDFARHLREVYHENPNWGGGAFANLPKDRSLSILKAIRDFSLDQDGRKAIGSIESANRYSPEDLAKGIRETYNSMKESGNVPAHVIRSIESSPEFVHSGGLPENRGGTSRPGGQAELQDRGSSSDKASGDVSRGPLPPDVPPGAPAPGSKVAPQEEPKSVHPVAQAKFDQAMEGKDAELLGQILHPGNKALRKMFQDQTGVKLPPGMNATRVAIRNYFEGLKTPESTKSVESAGKPKTIKDGETFTHQGREYRMHITEDGQVKTRDLSLNGGPPIVRSWGSVAEFEQETGIKVERPEGPESKSQDNPGVSPEHFAHPFQQFGDYVVARALDGESLDNIGLRKRANLFFKGQPSQKDLYDAVELGVNRHILAHPELFNVQNVPIKKVVNNLEELVAKLPTQTHREAGSNEFQQYSTPPFYSAVVSWVANVKPSDLVLEPSAGVGGLAVFPRLAGAEVMVNEFDRSRRAKLLEAMPGWKKIGVEDARFINAHMKKSGTVPTVVIMNPPFSSTSGKVEGKRDSGQGVKHIQSALDALAPGGRLVAIMGDMEGKNWRNWLEETKTNGTSTVQALVKVDGSTYRKYGTSFGSVVLVMDKVPPRPGHEVVQGKVANLEDLADLLRGVRDGRDADPPQQAGLATEHAGSSVEPSGGKAHETEGNPGSSGDDAVVSGGGRSPEQLEPEGKSRRPGAVQAGQGGGSGQSSGVRGGAQAIHEPAGMGSEAGGKGGTSSVQSAEPGPVHTDEPGSGSGEVSQPSGASEHPGGAGSQDVRDEHVGDTKTSINRESAKVSEADETPDGIFSSYRPSKVSFPGAKPHPGDLVESQAMAAVDLPDPRPTTKIHIPEEIIKAGKLSDAQLEAIFYATQATNVVKPNSGAEV